MKTYRFLAILAALSITLMGCPYESNVPVDEVSKATMDNRLLGRFTEKSKEDYVYEINADGNRYRIVKKNTKSTDEPTVYYAFLSKLGANSYINVSEEGSNEPRYYIYKINISGNGVIKLKGVTDNVSETFSSSAEFRAFIAKYENLSFFFDKDEELTFTREN